MKCRTCGGTILPPTRGGVPRGSCHCTDTRCRSCGRGLKDAGFWEPVDGVLSETQGHGPFCSRECGADE